MGTKTKWPREKGTELTKLGRHMPVLLPSKQQGHSTKGFLSITITAFSGTI